jgi:hypothetical protein
VLYRAAGLCVHHLRDQGGTVVIERATPPPVGRRAVDRLKERLRRPVAGPRTGLADATCFPPSEARALRPRPGIDTPLADHDPAALYQNCYLLGHRSEFSLDRLIAAIDSIRNR